MVRSPSHIYPIPDSTSFSQAVKSGVDHTKQLFNNFDDDGQNDKSIPHNISDDEISPTHMSIESIDREIIRVGKWLCEGWRCHGDERRVESSMQLPVCLPIILNHQLS